MKKPLLVAAFLVLAASVVPAQAGSITIDSTNCNSSGGCFGLSWTLDVYADTNTVDGTTYEYVAILTVTDDPTVDGVKSQTISAVSFKASEDINGIYLADAPTDWTNDLTAYGPLTGGSTCIGTNTDFGCSQTTTAIQTGTDPTSEYVWVWYFNTTTGIAVTDEEMHIGAKLTTLDRNGKLLSASATVPEPSSLSMLGIGLVGLLASARRRWLRR